MIDPVDLAELAELFSIRGRRIQRRARKLGRWLPGLVKRLDQAIADLKARQ